MNVRKNNWLEEHDELLAETILKHIREGSTQLAAFEEAGKKLNRTPQACGFRWNNTVRKKYEEEIKEAKNERALLKNNNGLTKSQKRAKRPSIVDGELILRYIQEEKKRLKDMKELRQDLRKKEKEIKRLKQENEKLNKKLQEKSESLRQMSEDYDVLVKIMDRARKLIQLHDEQDKIKFVMDQNGNLERLG